MTALGAAAFHDHWPVCEVLIKAGADPNSWNLFPDADYAHDTFSPGAPKGRTALMLAASRGHMGTVARLVELGANPDLRNEKGQTALSVTAEYKNPIDRVRQYLIRVARPPQD